MIYPPRSAHAFHQRENINSQSEHQKIDVYALDREGFFDLWLSVKRRDGKSDQKILGALEEKGVELSINSLEFARDYFSNAKSGAKVVVLANDLAKSGDILTHFYTTTKGGKEYVVFKGNQRLRNIITGTRYLSRNAKVVNFGVGGKALKSGAKSGFIISIIFSVSLNSIKWIFDDEYRWSSWVKDVSVDIIKIAIASIAGYLSAVSIAASVTLAIGSAPVILPVGVGLAVCIGVAFALDKYDFEKKLEDLAYLLSNCADKVRNADETFEDGVYYLINEAGKYFRYKVRRLFVSKLNTIKRGLSPQWKF